jgi:NAD(P)-dependent dehydrogenase (short-subunit alcohol dehydrogenase family)
MVLKHKSGIVTGGASGIGEATVRRLLKEGARVVAFDRDLRRLEGLSASIGRSELCVLSGDVASPRGVEGAVDACVKFAGGVDFLVNAAGITHAATPLHELPVDEFKRIIDVNLTGTFLAMRAAVAAMVAAGKGGAIVNIASTGAIRPPRNAGAYSASKFGVAGLTGSAAIELASFGIRVNAVCPGVTDTPLFRAIVGESGDTSPAKILQDKIPIGRLGRADEIANAVVWLLSEESSYVTGSLIPVDGGLLLT